MVRGRKRVKIDDNPNPQKYIPIEICEDILARLPAKSLMRFRCVSKLWLSNIDSREFRSKHMKMCKTNKEKNTLMLLERSKTWQGKSCILRNLEKFRKPYHQFDLMMENKKDHFEIESQVNGVILLHLVNKEESKDGWRNLGKRVVLWNPSIRKALVIPPPKVSMEIPHLKFVKDLELEISIGYDPITYDYKLLSFVYFPFNVCCPSVDVYSLNTRSWKNLSMGTGFDFRVSSKDVYLDGFIYMTAHVLTASITNEGGQNMLGPRVPSHGFPKATHLISFDVANEVLYQRPLPNDDNRFGSTKRDVALVGDSLALFDSCVVDSCVWILDKSSGESKWIKKYTITAQINKAFFVDKIGLMLFQNNTRGWKKYELETGKIECLGRRPPSCISHVDLYVESLELFEYTKNMKLTSLFEDTWETMFDSQWSIVDNVSSALPLTL